MARATPRAPEVSGSRKNRGQSRGRTDAQLLREFIAGPSEPAEAAFAVLVERYGPIVHAVSFDVLGCSHDAQDAAQAVFLVLARKARSIRKPEALGPWLHGVAIRVARRARAAKGRLRAIERRKAEMTYEHQNSKIGPEIGDHMALHEEIDRLPLKYRQPIILCYLQGQTQTEAAEALGWPLGTVQTRLHRGRECLRNRLTRRRASVVGLMGETLTASLAASPGRMAREWNETTAFAAVRFAAGKDTAALIARPVLGLAESVLTGMLAESVKMVAFCALSFAFVSAVLLWTAVSVKDILRVWSQAQSPLAAVPRAERESTPDISNPKLAETKGEAPDLAAGLILPIKLKPRDVKRSSATLEHEKPPAPLTRDEKPGDRISGPSPFSSGRSSGAAVPARSSAEWIESGRELFARVWVKGDSRSHGGDGLGPVFNAQSCVACHHMGGPGGAGGAERNIEIATAFEGLGQGNGYFYSFSMDFGAGRFEYRIGGDPQTTSQRCSALDAASLARTHPGFRDSTSTVLHHYSTDPAYLAWRGLVPGVHGSILVRTSQRNPPSLFGDGLIDAIPDDAIEAVARRKPVGGAQIKGRVSRLKDGRIGRFGWKAQTASLADFVRSAAAGEMGLEVPGHHQAADPRLPGIAAPGLDMNESECESLVAYVRSLRAPTAIEPTEARDPTYLKAGEATFKLIGCASCHVPNLGNVLGVYSDLLLHDMGSDLADSSNYGVFVGEMDPPEGGPVAGRARAENGLASPREWRTPPLWGVRDSAPYLHDGRAATAAEAIALHSGQGAGAARRYAELSPRRKQQLEAFILSIASPGAQK